MQYQENQVQVNKILYRGLYQDLTSPFSVKDLTRIDLKGLGATTARIQGYKCPRCSGNFGYLFFDDKGCMYFCGNENCLKDDKEHSLKIKHSIQTKEEHKEASKLFGIGNRYYNASLSKVQNLQYNQQEAIQKWIIKPENFLVVLGPPGVGKTYLCAALANHFLSKKEDVKYTNFRRVFEHLQKAIGQGKNQSEALNDFLRHEILILDDLAASTNSEWQKEIVLDLIDTRYSSNQPTIVTSNLTEDVMKEILGERIKRRIYAPENRLVGMSFKGEPNKFS